MTDVICISDHTQHICALAEQKKLEEIGRLVTKPQYVCANCGRAADRSENLCNPKPINQFGLM